MRVVALLVGIDDYPPPVPPLRACRNDVAAVAELLGGRSEAADVAVLLDAEATRSAVVEAFRTHLGTARAGDAALFWYCGHGSQAPAAAGGTDEVDAMDETIVLADSRLPGGWDLTDGELGVLAGEVTARGAHLVVVLDCCHSGSGTRADPVGLRERWAPPDRRVRPAAQYLGAGGADRLPGSPSPRTGAGHVLLAACRADETAKEVGDGAGAHGAFSMALGAALRSARGTPTYREVHRAALATVRSRVPRQHPQLESSAAGEIDRPFLAGVLSPAPAYLTLTHAIAGWVLDAGAVHGVPAPVGDQATELLVMPGGAAEGDGGGAGRGGDGSRRGGSDGDGVGRPQPVATARVTAVHPDHCEVSVSDPLEESRTYRAVVVSAPLPPVPVELVGAAAVLAPVRAALAESGSWLVAATTERGTGELVVDASRSGVTIRRRGAAATVDVAGSGADDTARRVVHALEHIARWLRLVRLENPMSTLAPSAVLVRLETPEGRSDDDGHLALAYDGDVPPRFAVVLRNTSARVLWCALVDLTETYGVYPDAFPAGSQALAPGEEVRADLVGELPGGARVSGGPTDHLKVIVSTVEFDPRPLQQADLEAASPAAEPVRGQHHPRSTLDRVLGGVVTRRVSLAPATEVADWRTEDLFVTVRRAGPAAEPAGPSADRT